MSILDLFNSGFKKKNQDHFAAIVRVAMGDGEISDDEKAFLKRLAFNLDIENDQFKTILKDYNDHPINPPTSYDKRLERLFDLARMVYFDEIVGVNELNLLTKIAVGLGFSPENVKYIVDKALILVNEGADLDSFVQDMRSIYR